MKHFLQRNKNTSLNYYDFSNHFYVLCLFTEESGKVCLAKETTAGHSKISTSRKYFLLLFFLEKSEKVNAMHTN